MIQFFCDSWSSKRLCWINSSDSQNSIWARNEGTRTGPRSRLEAGGEVNAAPDVDRVVGFQNIFAAVVESSIAEEEAEAAIGEVVLVILLDGVRDQGESGAILFATPPCAACS